MPHLSSNLSSTIFSGSIFSELIQIARYTIKTDEFMTSPSDLLLRMIAQGGNRATLTKQLKNVFHRYPTVFQNFGKTQLEIDTSIMKNT